MHDWFKTVISQYANSPTMLRLLESISDWIDPQSDFQNFFDNIWDIDTANGYGLDVWGRIVGVGRTIQAAVVPAYFGFKDTGAHPFNSARFYSAMAGPSTENVTLDDVSYRKLIFAKAMANIMAANIPRINALLRLLFAGRGRAYVSAFGSMAITYTFEFRLLPIEKSILSISDLAVRPAGVLLNIIELPPSNFFAFSQFGATAQTFGHGVFFASATRL